MTGPKRMPQPGQDQRDQWRKALADHNRNKRNKRGRRPAKPITGIRWTPPEDAAMTTVADIIGRAIRQPGWYHCRSCRQPFRSSTYYDTCWWCWDADHPTKVA